MHGSSARHDASCHDAATGHAMILLMLLALVRASFTDAATAAQCMLIAMCVLISRSFSDADAR
jgi:hypothetical protein